jgi:hypothetical protein
MSLKINILALISCTIFSSHIFGQEGKVIINQDKHIAVLLDLKKELNKTENSTDRYKIQVYSGNRAEAENTQSNFNATFSKWPSTIVYEYPNFKIWAGNFNTRLEADRSLKEVKQKFSSAFIFKPKK